MDLTLERQKDMDRYVLLKDLPLVKKGTVFVHDKEDRVRGSLMSGCLKLAWTDDGNCQHMLCADTIVFHAKAIYEKDWFMKIEDKKYSTLIQKLEAIIDELKMAK